MVIDGANLGCVVAVAFGKVVTYEAANVTALLRCGTTDQLAVTAPPGVAGTNVAVRVATVESVLDPSGREQCDQLHLHPERAQRTHRRGGDGEAGARHGELASAGK